MSEQEAHQPPALTREEILAETVLAAKERRLPDFSARLGTPVPAAPAAAGAPAASPAADPEVFTAADLAELRLPAARKYALPGTGKHLWVHASTGYDVEMMAEWIRLKTIPVTPDDTEEQKERKASQAALNNLYFQVICCCRRGSEPTAARCFDLTYLPALKRLLPVEVVQEIVRISIEVGRAEEQLGEAARDFFARARTCLQNWLSASAAWGDCPPGLRQGTEEFVSLVTAALSLGKLDTGISPDG